MLRGTAGSALLIAGTVAENQNLKILQQLNPA
jgi:hypothetical protein